jgi:hypothetical protein
VLHVGAANSLQSFRSGIHRVRFATPMNVYIEKARQQGQPVRLNCLAANKGKTLRRFDRANTAILKNNDTILNDAIGSDNAGTDNGN